MEKAYRYRFYPTTEQEQLLQQTNGRASSIGLNLYSIGIYQNYNRT